MAGKTNDGGQQARFLLGRASEAERELLEAEFFSNEDAFQEMLEAEDDLFDAYARGELSADERLQFEQRFLKSPDGRERVHFARVFAGGAGSRPVSRPLVVAPPTPGFFASIFSRPAFQLAPTMIAVAAVVGFSWLLVERSRMNGELNELRAERALLGQKVEELQHTTEAERARVAEALARLEDLQRRVPNEPQQLVPSPAVQQAKKQRDEKPLIVTNDEPIGTSFRNDRIFDLTPGSTRGGRGNTLEVPRNASSVGLRISLETPASLQNYRAAIETAEGRKIWHSDVFNIDGTSTVLTVPATNLRSGYYILEITGAQADNVFEKVASYSFRVAKK